MHRQFYIKSYEVNSWLDGVQVIKDEPRPDTCTETYCSAIVTTPEDGFWCFQMRSVNRDGFRSVLSNEVCHIAGPTALYETYISIASVRPGNMTIRFGKTNGGKYQEVHYSINGGEWIYVETELIFPSSYAEVLVDTPETGDWCFRERWHNKDRTEASPWNYERDGKLACAAGGPYGAPARTPVNLNVSFESSLDYIYVRWQDRKPSDVSFCRNQLQERFNSNDWVLVHTTTGCDPVDTVYKHDEPVSGEWCYRVRAQWEDENALWSEWSEAACVTIP